MTITNILSALVIYLVIYHFLIRVILISAIHVRHVKDLIYLLLTSARKPISQSNLSVFWEKFLSYLISVTSQPAYRLTAVSGSPVQILKKSAYVPNCLVPNPVKLKLEKKVGKKFLKNCNKKDRHLSLSLSSQFSLHQEVVFAFVEFRVQSSARYIVCVHEKSSEFKVQHILHIWHKYVKK